MSVYTELSTEDFGHLLSQYDLGIFVRAQGIAAGIENTNYKITLKKSGAETDYFLTVFEDISESELDFFIPLLAHLKSNNCHVAGPKAQISGQYVFTAKGKPAAIFDCLAGYHVEDITQTECFTIGAELARIHLAAENFTAVHQNPRGYYWLRKQINNSLLTVSPVDKNTLEKALSELQIKWELWQSLDLPKGFIHGDLFADNCLFENESTVNGVIDFYAGGNDYWAYDLAICILAWCAQDSTLSASLKAELIKGYQSVRSLTKQEIQELDDFIKLAALRFWVSRLVAAESTSEAALTTSKNPEHMKDILLSLG